MKTFFDYLNERKLSSILASTTININIESTKHAEERQTRHGDTADAIITSGEIIDTCNKASEKILNLLVTDKLDTDVKFLIYNSSSFLNCVCILNTNSFGSMDLKIITVMRKEKFLIDKDMLKITVK